MLSKRTGNNNDPPTKWHWQVTWLLFSSDQSAVVCAASPAAPTRVPDVCPTLARSTTLVAKMPSAKTLVRGQPAPALLGTRVIPTSDVSEVKMLSNLRNYLLFQGFLSFDPPKASSFIFPKICFKVESKYGPRLNQNFCLNFREIFVFQNKRSLKNKPELPPIGKK